MEVTGSPKFLAAMLRLKRDFPEGWEARDAIIDEVAHLQRRLKFFQPRCAQCDAPLEVHPYQCKLWGLCDKCVGDVDAGDPREPAPDLTVLDVAPGGKVDLAQVKTRYVALRVTAVTEPSTSGSIEVRPVDFMRPTCPGCGHVGCVVNSEGCAAGACSCEALKRPDPNTWKPGETIAAAVAKVDPPPGLPVCPWCSDPLHSANPEENSKLCPGIPF